MELVALQVDVPGQDVVQDHVLDEVPPVVLLVVVLLDAVEGHRQNAHEFLGLGVVAGHEDGIFRTGPVAEGFVGVLGGLQHLGVREHLGGCLLAHLADLAQLAAGDNDGGLIDHADGAVDGIPHLMDDPLEQSIRHCSSPFFAGIRLPKRNTAPPPWRRKNYTSLFYIRNRENSTFF